MRVLIAEDDSLSRELLVDFLEELGHEVTATHDGQSAWDTFCAAPCRMIISDWQMPHVDGLELCRRVRRALGRPYTYFMLVTSLSDRANYLTAMAGGVDDFLAKPPDAHDLAARLVVAERILDLLEEVRQLKGLLKICSYCKRIHDVDGQWQPVEVYVSRRSDARFTHTICQDCVKEHSLEHLFPEHYQE